MKSLLGKPRRMLVGAGGSTVPVNTELLMTTPGLGRTLQLLLGQQTTLDWCRIGMMKRRTITTILEPAVPSVDTTRRYIM